MSEKNILMIIILIILIPISLIMSNIKAFVILASLILIFFSLSSIVSVINHFNKDTKKEKKIIKEYEKETKEMSKMIGIDLNKFGDNIKISRNIMLIIYFIISIFFITNKIVQSIGIVIIAYYIYEGIIIIDNSINHKAKKTILGDTKVQKLNYILQNFLIIFFTSFILYTNFLGSLSN